jgi:glycine cleavage system H protein
MNVPSELRYTKSHEWVRISGDEATVGITDFAQSELGDIVYVELPEAGRVLQQEETFGTVESVKTVSDLYAPISGEVIAANDSLSARAEVVNSDPYGEAWMVKIRMSKPDEAGTLLDAATYEKQAQEH